ncbi:MULTISPECIES: DUF4376 domain-containing protein [Pseudomonas]|uniref:DUF4376 domain-containing protein n=1 Tax=Pseudomonas TaxID=286 RepID=UPI001B343AF6|nr:MULTISPECIES: DUF4376 domain-containing protein [Pseudomonas]MBP5945098.1 DUF4376 domain-containing protein [Pseudomonas sp. P9(2020)]MBP5957273.1 DUF4376 domain-containing protein [Pseudomonas anatoliensis]MBZ9561687.1 DUF4376 domain-containing protein [Pseudomonas sp. P116]
MKFATFSETGELTGRYDSALHSVIPEQAVELSDEVFLATRTDQTGEWRLLDGQVVKVPFAIAEPNYPELFAQTRFLHETHGIAVEGLNIETTRDSQALIASTGLSAILDPEYRCNFKTLDGFVQLDAAQILNIARSVRAHVQACFDRELDLLSAFESGTYTDQMLVDGWPDSSTDTPVSAHP